MKRVTGWFVTFLVVVLSIAAGGIAVAEEKPVTLVPVLKINTELDRRTVIKPSTIPGAGNGLFAAVAIKKDEVIGELGGQLRTEEDYPPDSYYMASIPECAWEETQPYRYLDSKHFGANVSRINFAPKSLNGVETKFQNSALVQLCNYPYVVFTALRDIEAGEEIWASYGPYYDYTFMAAKEVREFFCALARIECGEEYAFVP
jgi:SET domain-containing protein